MNLPAARLRAALRCDLVLQWRSGFFLAGAAVAGFWIALLAPLPTRDLAAVVPAFALTNLTTTTFYFVAAMVLFERGEGSLTALVVTPLRAGEYLLARGLTLGALGVVETLGIVALAYDGPVHWGPLVLSSVLMAAFYTWIGFAIVARYDSITDYLMPSVLYVTVLQLPLLHHFDLWRSPIFLLWPSHAHLLVARAAVEPVSTSEWSYGLAWGALSVLGAFALAQRAFRRFVVRHPGSAR